MMATWPKVFADGMLSVVDDECLRVPVELALYTVLMTFVADVGDLPVRMSIFFCFKGK